MLDAIDALDADVTTVEAARSTMQALEQFGTGVPGGVGPGVYDVHSPRVPTVSEIEQLLLAAQRWVGPERLWANPDCGLKTRGEVEVVEALGHLVRAAHRVRSSTPTPV